MEGVRIFLSHFEDQKLGFRDIMLMAFQLPNQAQRCEVTSPDTG